ncbi:(2Fe-2S)-binding protein [Prauserella endophytica]|uniref:(2Fe-2S)-binding protein n=1 Tax=Prauserella endophytica TaxID=1592324 RepID=A0ABY2S418_9PSEU|nr:(2Fe-2S)-binding protein [Prauserella endophytica]TKG70549.1 (2Fe-2S)-binding protein [Prauserella endophytica]
MTTTERATPGQRAPRAITVRVNGEEIEGAVEPRTHLADFLREKAQLTGTHTSCHQGPCGACTVLVDGQSARSCLTLAVQADGAEITTVEGIADGSRLSLLQQAFIEHFGFQCGYCTPGMVVIGAEILAEAAAGAVFTRDDLRVRLSANLCRCTGYIGIVNAVEAALAAQARGESA